MRRESWQVVVMRRSVPLPHMQGAGTETCVGIHLSMLSEQYRYGIINGWLRHCVPYFIEP